MEINAKIRDHSYITSSRGWVGGVDKMITFDYGGGWVDKAT